MGIHFADVYASDWKPLDGETFTYDGHEWSIRVAIYDAIHPYPYRHITVSATIVDKTTDYYQDIKRELGDDWEEDLLADDTVAMYVAAQSQLRGEANPDA